MAEGKGPARRRGRQPRPVICLETGEEFESAAAVAMENGTSQEAIRYAIRTGGRGGGFHWAFADDQDIADKLERYIGGDHAHRRGGKVICLETGEEYESVAAAAAASGKAYPTVKQAIRTVGRAGGYHWTYSDDPELADKLERYFGGVVRAGRGRPKRPVVCLETGEEYESAAAAAIGTRHSTVYQAIRTGGRSGGYHWAYADDQDIAAKLEQYAGGESRVQAVTSVESAPYTVTGAVSDLSQNTVDGSLRGKQADETLMQDFSIKAAHAARDKRQKVPARVGLRDQGIKQ